MIPGCELSKILGQHVAKPWSKRLKPSGAAYRKLTANRKKFDEISGSIYTYKKAEKVGRVMMRKVATSRKSRNH